MGWRHFPQGVHRERDTEGAEQGITKWYRGSHLTRAWMTYAIVNAPVVSSQKPEEPNTGGVCNDESHDNWYRCTYTSRTAACIPSRAATWLSHLLFIIYVTTAINNGHPKAYAAPVLRVTIVFPSQEQSETLFPKKRQASNLFRKHSSNS